MKARQIDPTAFFARQAPEFQRMGRSNLPGQLELPQTDEHLATLARMKANEPLRPTKPQLPADHGLFSDEALQIDLIEMLMEPIGE